MMHRRFPLFVALLLGLLAAVKDFTPDTQANLTRFVEAFKKGVGAQAEETPPSTAAQPGDTAKPISAQATTTAPGTVHQDTAAKV